MSIRACRWCLGLMLGGATFALLTLGGCSQQQPVPSEKATASPALEVKSGGDQKKEAATTAVQLTPAEQARLHQSFKDAVLLEPVADGEQLVDVTCAGKNTAKLFEAIAGKDNKGGLWDQVRFADSQGQLLRYRAILTTSLGEIHVDLYPQAAPNHVRSFIALARAGYFDGLPIYRSVRESDGDVVVNAYIESGCPKGTGDVGYGSIGYWLKPEIEGNKLTHEAGAVGAWHREELESAACRFYVTAEKMPHMDGYFTMFGKVTHGLDVVRTINTRPVEAKSTNLKERVPIEKVVIQVLEDGNPQAMHAN